MINEDLISTSNRFEVLAEPGKSNTPGISSSLTVIPPTTGSTESNKVVNNNNMVTDTLNSLGEKKDELNPSKQNVINP